MTTLWRLVPWINRLVLLFPTAIFTLIGLRSISDPVHAAAESGIVLDSPLAVTIMRVGFGGFPLAFAIITFACLISTRRHLIGLSLVATVVAVLLVIRIVAVTIDHTASLNAMLLRAEAILLTVVTAGLLMETGRRRNRPLNPA